MKGYIKIGDALKWIWDNSNRNIPFNIAFCTLDKKRQSGGEVIELTNAVIPSRETIKDTEGNVVRPSLKSIDQNRLQNATFNLYVPERNRFYQVHNDLILFFQNKRVIY
jgi:hypothetical protein